MNTWDKMKQDGFTLIDQKRKIAIKPITAQDNALEVIKKILIKSYIDYLIEQRKEKK